MKYIITLTLFFFSFSAWAENEPTENDSANMVIEMMVVAKATGMCGVFSQMANFQQTTKMKGGDEFVVRFLTTEAVRLGHTLESFMAQCPEVVKKYNAYMELLGYEE